MSSVLDTAATRPARILDPGNYLSLRPLMYPSLYARYKGAEANMWHPNRVDFSSDRADLEKLNPDERRLVERLIAFFATADGLVANNLVFGLYRHINAPEARMYLGRQLSEEGVHIDFYTILLDTYIADSDRRAEMFRAIETLPCVRRKAEFAAKYTDSLVSVTSLETADDRRRFLLGLLAFAAAIEGLFFFGAFAYVYYFRSRGLLRGLADGTAWVFRDESGHMGFAFEVAKLIIDQYPDTWDQATRQAYRECLKEAVEAEAMFAEDVCQGAVSGITAANIREYLQCVADTRLVEMGLEPEYGSRNPLKFLDLQGMEDQANGFERTVTAYQLGFGGEIRFDAEF